MKGTKRIKSQVRLLPEAASLTRLGAIPTQSNIDRLTEKSIALTAEERKQQDALIQFLVGDEVVKGLLAKSTRWYCAYLQSKFKQHWHLLAATLVDIDGKSVTPKAGDLVAVYSFLLEIAKLLKSTPELALVTIVDELDNENLVKPQLDEERAVPNQAVFAAIGWLSMRKIFKRYDALLTAL